MSAERSDEWWRWAINNVVEYWKWYAAVAVVSVLPALALFTPTVPIPKPEPVPVECECNCVCEYAEVIEMLDHCLAVRYDVSHEHITED